MYASARGKLNGTGGLAAVAIFRNLGKPNACDDAQPVAPLSAYKRWQYRRALVAVQPYGLAFAATAPRPIGEPRSAHWGQACSRRSWLVQVRAISGAFLCLSQNDPTRIFSGFAGGGASAEATHSPDSVKWLCRRLEESGSALASRAASTGPALEPMKSLTYGGTSHSKMFDLSALVPS
jgi:hypothetical protein